MDITELTFNDRDEFSRKQIAEKAIALLTAEIDISPMVIDGGWGTGKTEFCHKLINLMKEDDTHHLIYIDAFKADHANEPLMAILAEVIKVLPSEDEKQGFIKKALPAVRFGLKTVAKAGVSHLLRQDAADVANDFDKEIQKTADKAIDATVESLLKDHVKAEQNLKALQEALREIAKEKPIVLFVDELDRCRPDFAVDMLEIMKHTFGVEGVSFVLVTNTQQLKASINHCYGSSVDAQRYLDKFLKFSFKLSEEHSLNNYDYTHVSESHFRELVNKSQLLEKCRLLDHDVFSVIKHLIKLHNISLREIETFIRNLEIYQTLANDEGLSSNIIFGFKLLRIFGVWTFTFNPKLAHDILSEQTDAKTLGAFLGQEQLVNYNGTYEYPEHYQTLAVMLGQECAHNSDIFVPDTEESKEYWKQYISQCFNNRWLHRGDGGTTSIVKVTLQFMCLSR